MTEIQTFWVVVVLACGIILAGIPIAYGLGVLCLGVTVVIVGAHRLPLLGSVAYGEVATYALIAIPLFIFTAELLAAARMSDNAFDVFARRLRKLPASLAVASNVLSTILAAIMGSSAGATAIMARVALNPMLSRGYDARLACGVILAGAALDVLIPPSTLMVLYGVITEVSIGQLLIGGLIPGLLMAALMTIYVVALGTFRPHLVGKRPDGSPLPLTGEAAELAAAAEAAMQREQKAHQQVAAPQHVGWLHDLRMMGPLVMLLAFMSWGIYAGIATSSEIAGIGAAGAIVLVWVYRRLTFRTIKLSLLRTSAMSAMILLILVMAEYLGRLLAFMNIPNTMVDMVKDLGWSPMAVVMAVNILLLFLGTFLDSGAIILIFGPLFHTLMTSLGFDPIWWAVVFVINMEIALLTPPFGINLFVLKAVAPYLPSSVINRGVMPFIYIHVSVLALCILIPELITWLPKRML
jgi:C4-dicarboxylate transporter DctM subunit